MVESFKTYMHIIDSVANYVYVLWMWSAAIVKFFRINRCMPIVAELRPFIPSIIAISWIDHILQGAYIGDGGWLIIITDLFDILVWKFYKDVGDDDRWKKRMKKAAGKVKALASGRLVVVPNNA